MTSNLFQWNFEVGDRGVLAPGRLLIPRGLGWAALLFAVAFGFFYASVAGADWLGLRGSWAYLPPIFLPVLGFWLYALAVRWGENRRAVEVCWGRSTATDLLLGFLIGSLLVSSMLLLLWACGLYHVERGHWAGAWVFLLYNGYISGMLEELMFRAILLRVFARLFGPVAALVLSALCFGLAHLSHDGWRDVGLLLVNAGLPLGLAYMMTGRLWLAVGMHIGYDFCEGSLLGVNNPQGLLLSSPDPARAAVLTGGAGGVDSSALSAIVGMGLIVVLLLAYRRWRRNPVRGDRFLDWNRAWR